MNILITGANGQLGNEMRDLSAGYPQHSYFFTDVHELDICDEQGVRAYVKDHAIDLVVNCAAYTAVDKAEDNADLCDKLNHLAPGDAPLQPGDDYPHGVALFRIWQQLCQDHAASGA